MLFSDRKATTRQLQMSGRKTPPRSGGVTVSRRGTTPVSSFSDRLRGLLGRWWRQVPSRTLDPVAWWRSVLTHRYDCFAAIEVSRFKIWRSIRYLFITSRCFHSFGSGSHSVVHSVTHQLFIQSAIQYILHLFGSVIRHSVNQSIKQPFNQPVIQSISQSISHSVSQ